MSAIFDNALTTLGTAPFITGQTLLTAGLIWWNRRHRDSSDPTKAKRLEHDHPLDPYQLAYLRGGAREMTRLALFDMIGRGWFTLREESSVFTSDRFIQRAADAPPEVLLSSMEREIWRQLEQPILLSQLMSTHDLPGRLAPFGEVHERDLKKLGFIPSDVQIMTSNRALLASGAIIMLPGLYRSVAAWTQQEPAVLVYLFWAIAGAILLFALAGLPQRTSLGERYLEFMRSEYQRMRDHIDTWGALANNHMLFIGAIFGAQALLPPPHSPAGSVAERD